MIEKNSEAIANLWLFPRIENPCSLPQSLDPSIFLAFHATLSSLFAKDFLLQLLAKNAASLHWNRNENLRFLARFQTTTANLETPVRRRTIHGLQNLLVHTSFSSELGECKTTSLLDSSAMERRDGLAFVSPSKLI